MTDMIYLYDGSFEGFLSCIFDSYRFRESPTEICPEDETTFTLFPTRVIPTDASHAARVLHKITACSSTAAALLKKGFCTCLPEKELHLYRMIAKLLREGPAFLKNFSDETLYPILRAVHHLNSEVHQWKGFVRFSQLGGVLGSEIEPKNRVLPFLRVHFCARCQELPFFIYDRTHKEVLFCADGLWSIRPLESFQMAPPDVSEAHYRLLWKQFYDTIAIRERYNPKCRQTQMPKRYWSTMTEFQEAAFFIPQSSPADAPVPAAPAARSVPEIPAESGLSAPASSP